MTDMSSSGQAEGGGPAAQQGGGQARDPKEPRDFKEPRDARKTRLRQPLGARGSTRRKTSPAKWAMAILIIIGLIALAIVLAGVHIGARGQGRWYTETVLWAAKLFQ